ncbi:MAG: PilZ domain-containing protein [Myxococcales bacterium]|nr:PilZ domain-containing protein [Myxococcales bacterium]
MEKRRHRRLKAPRVAGHVRADRRAAACAVENISSGGMFVRTAVSLPIGVAVLVDLVRPGLEGSFQVSGRVVNVVPLRAGDEPGLAPGVGIAFDPLPEDVRKRLRALLRQLNHELTEAETATPKASEPTPPALDSTLVRLEDGLFANVKGMFDELSKAQAELQARDEEIANLKEEIPAKARPRLNNGGMHPAATPRGGSVRSGACVPASAAAPPIRASAATPSVPPSGSAAIVGNVVILQITATRGTAVGGTSATSAAAIRVPDTSVGAPPPPPTIPHRARSRRA